MGVSVRHINKVYAGSSRRSVLDPTAPDIRDLIAACPDVDLCGERGEYHTFVYDGPGFRAPVDFALGEPVLSEGYWIRPAHPA